MSQSQFKQYFATQEVKQAPPIGEIQNTSKMIEEEIDYQNEIKTSNVDSLSFKQIWDKFQNEAMDKLNTTAQFMKKYRNAFYAGVAGTLLTVAPQVMNVNPANAFKVNATAKTESVKTNKIAHVENYEVTGENAQAIKKAVGLENVSDEDYSKMLKATFSDSGETTKNSNDAKKLAKYLKSNNLLDADGTLNTTKAVKEFHLNYLSQGTTPNNSDKVGGESKTPTNSLFNTVDGKITWNMEDETAKELAKLACQTNPAECTADNLNTYIEKNLGYKENPNQLNPESLKGLIAPKVQENKEPAKANPQPSQSPSPTTIPPVAPTQSPKTSETPAAESDGGTDEQAPKRSLTINTSKGKFVINSKIQNKLNKLEEQGEQTLGEENANLKSNEQGIYFTEPQLKSTVKKGFSSKATYSQRLVDRKNTILKEINPNNKAKVEDLQSLDSILASVNEAKATEKNQAKRQQTYDQATIEIDKLEKKIANNQEIKKPESNNWWITAIGIATAFAGGILADRKYGSGKVSKEEESRLQRENTNLNREIEARNKALKDNKISLDDNIRIMQEQRDIIANLQNQLDQISNPRPEILLEDITIDMKPDELATKLDEILTSFGITESSVRYLGESIYNGEESYTNSLTKVQEVKKFSELGDQEKQELIEFREEWYKNHNIPEDKIAILTRILITRFEQAKNSDPTTEQQTPVTQSQPETPLIVPNQVTIPLTEQFGNSTSANPNAVDIKNPQATIPEQKPQPEFKIFNANEMKNWTQSEMINYADSVFKEIKKNSNADIESLNLVENYIINILNTKQLQTRNSVQYIHEPDNIQSIYGQIGNDLISFGATPEFANAITSVIATLRNQEVAKNNPTPPRQNTNQ